MVRIGRPAYRGTSRLLLCACLAVAAATTLTLGTARGSSPTSGSPVDIPPNAKATMPLTVENHCSASQAFRVVPGGFPTGLVQGGDATTIPGNASADFPLLVDTTGIPAGLYPGKLTVICISCGSNCRQEQTVFHVSFRVGDQTNAPPPKHVPPQSPPPPPGSGSPSPPSPGGSTVGNPPPDGAGGAPGNPSSGGKDAAPPSGEGPGAAPPIPAPPPPPQSPKTEERPEPTIPPKIPSGCCACVEGLELKLITPTTHRGKNRSVPDPNGQGDPRNEPGSDSYGHEFKVFVYYRCKRITDASEKPGELRMQWFEETANPPPFYRQNGVQPGVETDILGVLGGNHPEILKKGTFGGWGNRHLCSKSENCPAPPPGDLSRLRFELTDKPWIPYGEKRNLKFRIRVESAEHCDCRRDKHENKAFEITATQVLAGGPGKDSTFAGPSGKAMRNGEVVKGTEKE